MEMELSDNIILRVDRMTNDIILALYKRKKPKYWKSGDLKVKSHFMPKIARVGEKMQLIITEDNWEEFILLINKVNIAREERMRRKV